ncbi:hypothetical protein [Cupriavidus sp. PET2-C1]
MKPVRTEDDYRRTRLRLRWLRYRVRICAAFELWESGGAYRARVEQIECQYPFLQLARQAARQDPLLRPVSIRLDDWREGIDIPY